MKKSLVLALAAVFMLGIAGTAFAAANPFSDVPADSWAYKAVAQLAKDGIIDGYPDGTFKGDKSMTRYEMAQIVYRAIQREDKTNAEQKALIDKLSAEFASELNNLGVKVDKLSDQVNNRIYLTGQVTLRYDNYNEKLQGVPQIQGTNGQKLFRTELYVNGKINDGWQYFASIRNDKTFGAVNSVQNAASISGTSASGNNYTQFRQAYVSSNLFGGYVAVGRQNNTPAYGFVASEDMTGLTVGGGGDVVTWEAFWGNTDAYWVSQQNTGSGTQWAAPFGTLYWGQNPVTWADLSVGAKLSDNLNVQVAYMNAMRSDGSSFPGFVSGNGGFDKTIGFMEAGFDWLFAPSWSFTGLFSNSTASNQNTGYRAQLDYGTVDLNSPGSWHAWVAYTKAEALSTWDSNYNDLPGYNNNTGNDPAPNFMGAKGWEVGFDYVWAKNVQMEVFYNNYAPTVNSIYNTGVNNTNYQHFRTDFYFFF